MGDLQLTCARNSSKGSNNNDDDDDDYDDDNNNNNNDITIRDNKQATCMSTDVAIPEERNVIKKELHRFRVCAM